jgi:hypothetical protein
MFDFSLGDYIDRGRQGSVYHVKYNGRNCIYKVEKIRADAIKHNEIYSTKYSYMRQIKFDEEVSRKYPDKFMILSGHGIINDCHEKKHVSDDITGSLRKEILSRYAKSDKCYYLIYYPVFNRRLSDMINSIYIDKKQFLKMYYDIIERISIMHNLGYVHNDIHMSNIMELNNNFYLIDYGYSYNNRFEKRVGEHANNIDFNASKFDDIAAFIYNCCISDPLETYIKINNMKSISEQKFYTNFNNDFKTLNPIIDKWMPNLKSVKAQKILLLLLDYDKYVSVCGFDIKKLSLIYHESPYKEIFLYTIKHYNRLDKVLAIMKS